MAGRLPGAGGRERSPLTVERSRRAGVRAGACPGFPPPDLLGFPSEKG